MDDQRDYAEEAGRGVIVVSVAEELQAAARAIRAQQAPDATFHHAVGQLLDQVALTTPDTVIESQASPIVRKGLAVARAYRSPGAPLVAVKAVAR